MISASGEQRADERRQIDELEFVSAVFKLNAGRRMERLYELKVLDCSGHGLGLLVTKRERELLRLVKPGDRISHISLYADAGLTVMNGTVRHQTRINHGAYRGKHILGLESETSLNFCRLGIESPPLSTAVHEPVVA